MNSRRVVHVRIAPLGLGVAAAGLALVLASCSGTNPATIATPFDPADGRNGQIGGEPGNGGGDGNYQGNGGIKLRNFLIVSPGNGQAGVVVGAISNDTANNARVTLTVAGTDASGQPQQLGTTTISVPAGGFVQLGNPVGASGSAGSASGSAGATGSATSPTSSAASPSSGAGSASGGVGASTNPTRSPGASAGPSPGLPPSPSPTSPSVTTTPSPAVGNQPAQGRAVWFQVQQVPQPAGAVIQLVARDPSLGSVNLGLPILPPVEEYSSLTPTGSSASGSASASPTGSPGGSPTSSPSANPSGAASQSPSTSTSASSSTSG